MYPPQHFTHDLFDAEDDLHAVQVTEIHLPSCTENDRWVLSATLQEHVAVTDVGVPGGSLVLLLVYRVIGWIGRPQEGFNAHVDPILAWVMGLGSVPGKIGSRCSLDMILKLWMTARTKRGGFEPVSNEKTCIATSNGGISLLSFSSCKKKTWDQKLLREGRPISSMTLKKKRPRHAQGHEKIPNAYGQHAGD